MTVLIQLSETLRDWAAFVYWQSFLFPGLAVILERLSRRAPWRAHLVLTLGIVAPVSGSVISFFVFRCGGGVVSPGSIWALEKQAAGPASLLGPVIFGGGLAVALILLYGIISARHLIFRAKPFPDRESQEALLEGSRMMQNVSLPILFTSGTVKSPVVWSWGLHPAVLLPESFCETLSSEERDAVFLHELAHITRRDHWAALLNRLCGVVLFWNPLYWLALTLADLAADRACDLLVLSREKLAPKVYCETLLRLAAEEKKRSAFQYLSRKEQLMKRIDTILDFEEDRRIFSVTGTPVKIFVILTTVVALTTALAFCQEKREEPPSVTPNDAKETAEKPSYEKTVEALIARFAQDDFNDAGFTQAMKDAKISDIAEALWNDCTKQFGAFVDSKTVKTESLLEFKRVHEHCEFENGNVVLMVVVDRADLVAGLFVMSAEKKKARQKIESYRIDKNLAHFPHENDFSTPEAAYAAYARTLCVRENEEYAENLHKISVPEIKRDTTAPLPADWANILLAANVLRVFRYGTDRAAVVAGLEGENIRKPFDVRWFRRIDGRWLNAGNDRVDSEADAEKLFETSVGYWSEKETSPKVVRFEPPSNTKNVDAEKTTELRVTFDRDMDTGGFSWCGGPPSFPETGDKPRWVDKRTCVLPVKLAPGKKYALSINAPSFKNFRSADGVPVEPVPYSFSTIAATPNP